MAKKGKGRQAKVQRQGRLVKIVTQLKTTLDLYRSAH